HLRGPPPGPHPLRPHGRDGAGTPHLPLTPGPGTGTRPPRPPQEGPRMSALDQLLRHQAAVRPHVPPRTPTETRLAAIWAGALGHEEESAVSVEDDFFESGGNSLIAVTLIGRVNREFGARVAFESAHLLEAAGEQVEHLFLI